ncbi:Transcriptional regulator, contains XRE-family HTH domain [Acetoanaerobium noterae]|uniref:Transcriptional regulator, contains XRE-family HTH domain n=1 Tax=Acetoanaerobium noterae TaxID=745369 RepID=A0A1T5AKJ2_9FIRM|nr:helix-turn-helix transcriptional regulator [Acetoanaerobium noterae]SKB35524.1 Transcriptional regulator, contains XRE-family HTH domain [Acetoanaerobium noterae]
MTFGNRLKMLRNEKQITQKELGSIINISERVIGYYESDDRFPKDDKVIIALSEYFNVSIDYLLGKSEIRNPYESHARIKDSIEDDPELLEFWEVLKEREDLQLMFKQTKEMSPKDIRQIIKIIKAIEDEEDAEN